MRLDLCIFNKYDLKSRTYARFLIERGDVVVDGIVRVKPSFEVSGEENILISDDKFQSLGAYKIKKATEVFGIIFKDKTAIDIGAANGGFTGYMLECGVAKVFAVDVADCALSESLIADSRVVVKSNLNARNICFDDIGELADIITVDVSFISLKLVLEPLKNLLKDNGQILALIKPQFELGKRAGKNGIVKSPKDRMDCINSVLAYAGGIGLKMLDICTVPKLFEDKNIEYLVLLVPDLHITQNKILKGTFDLIR